MRIGIDARFLSKNATGIGRYSEELIRELSKHQVELCLYSPQPFTLGCWDMDNVTLRWKNFNNRPLWMLWSQTFLPYWANLDQLDVFWGISHRLPYFLSNNIARVVTIHDLVSRHAGDTMRPISRYIDKLLMPKAVRMADHIIADSVSTMDDIIDEFPEVSNPVKVIYPSSVTLPEPLEISTMRQSQISKPYVLFVGTHHPRKNLGRLLEAFSQLPESIQSGYQLVIVGGKGWGHVDINALAQEKGISDKIIVTGYVSDQQLSTLYANAYCLLMPSIYEGFGLPIIEANSFGVPVITSNNSSMREIAGDAAILVDPLNVQSILDAIHRLLSNVTYRDQLASKAKINAQRFSWERAAEQTLAVFKEAIDARSKKLEMLL